MWTDTDPDPAADPIYRAGWPAVRTASAKVPLADQIGFAPPADPAEVGTLGPYRVLNELGRGGMGAVFTALDTRLNRRLALKVMLPHAAADADARQRFVREARAAARLSHDHVVPVYEADERDGVTYIAMPLLAGQTLDEHLREKGTLPLRQAVRIAREAAAGLAAAHAAGLVHRDMKPANLWLEAPHGRVKVFDFGLAKPMDATADVTYFGCAIGTPAYMSPEQAVGGPVDHRSDLFGLGAILYQLCTGRLPFPGPSVTATLVAVSCDDPPPLRSVNPAVPEPLAELVGQLLAKAPADRPASADVVVRRLRRIAAALDAGSAAPTEPANPFADIAAAPTPRPAAGPPACRRWLAAGLAAVTAVVLGGVVIVIRNADGTETRIEVPDGATVTVAPKPSPAAAAKPAAPEPWEATVAKLRGPEGFAVVLARLKELNPGFDPATAEPQYQDGVLVQLRLQDTARVADLSPVRGLPGLRRLSLTGGFANPTDLSPLRGLPLTDLECNGVPLRDLSPLRGMPLTRAMFWGNKTADLSPLAGMKLTSVNIGHSPTADLSPLAGMPIHTMHLNMSRVRDLSPLRGMPLDYLDLTHTPVDDLSPLAGLPITWLSLPGCPVRDYSVLKGLPLKSVTLDYDPAKHADLLRAIPTLGTINGKPARDLLAGDQEE